MRIGIPKEVWPGEKRVAVTPSVVAQIRKLGAEVIVQAGAGEGSSFLDGAYAEAGATIGKDAAEVWAASDVVLKVRPPIQVPGTDTHEANLLREGAALLGFIWPGQNKALVEQLAARGATVLAMDAVPRITRAQKMDALSAMANLVGYRAVIEAANHYDRFFPGQITAAGRVKPAQVLVIGAGVAGLAAIATAKSLGAVVRAFDTRPAVREQVESLGAKFIPFEYEEEGEGAGGYAKEMSPGYIAAEQALIADHAKEVDIIVSTALIPGKPAPQLITSGAVVSMDDGSVIVDLAAEQGGNCALTETDRIVTHFGVTIIGSTDLTSHMARQASTLYGATLFNLLEDVFDAEKGVVLDLEDEVHRGAVVLHAGKLLWPPPTRPKPRAAAPLAESKPPGPIPLPSALPSSTAKKVAALALFGVVFAAVGLVAPAHFLQQLTVFLLACAVGWHVIWSVSPALHTPLMSVTNAISGIILVGGLVLLTPEASPAVVGLAATAVLLASINVVGGFLVTKRMLRMFRR